MAGRPTRAELRTRRETPFGAALAALTAGASILDVLRAVFGASDAARVWIARFQRTLATVPHVAKRRRIVEHFLRTFDGARRHGSQWRVVDALGWIGRTYELVELEIVDAETGETSTETARRHVPGESAGGIAARQGVSPRTCSRYRRALREGRIMASAQPPQIDPSTGQRPVDAHYPAGDDARWAYAQHWLCLPPTPEMIRAWEAHPAPRADRRPKLSESRARAQRARAHWSSERARELEIDPADVPF